MAPTRYFFFITERVAKWAEELMHREEDERGLERTVFTYHPEDKRILMIGDEGNEDPIEAESMFATILGETLLKDQFGVIPLPPIMTKGWIDEIEQQTNGQRNQQDQGGSEQVGANSSGPNATASTIEEPSRLADRIRRKRNWFGWNPFSDS